MNARPSLSRPGGDQHAQPVGVRPQVPVNGSAILAHGSGRTKPARCEVILFPSTGRAGGYNRDMPTLDEIVAYCDRRTRRAAFQDFPGASNGLQVRQHGQVTRVGAAVDAGLGRSRRRSPPAWIFSWSITDCSGRPRDRSPDRPVEKLDRPAPGQLRPVLEPSSARRAPRDRQQRAAGASTRAQTLPLVSGARRRGHRLHRNEPDAAC